MTVPCGGVSNSPELPHQDESEDLPPKGYKGASSSVAILTINSHYTNNSHLYYLRLIIDRAVGKLMDLINRRGYQQKEQAGRSESENLFLKQRVEPSRAESSDLNVQWT